MEHDNTNALEWTEESRASINDYLDAVERVLLDQKVSRSERTLILGELESQIHSMVIAKSDAGASVSLSLVSSILETLDSPESYGRAEPTNDPKDIECSVERIEGRSTEGSVTASNNNAPASDDHAPTSNSDSSPVEGSTVEKSPAPDASSGKSPRFRIPWFTMPDVRATTQEARTKAMSFLNRARMDEFAIGSCLCSLMAIPMAMVGGRRNEGFMAFAMLLLLVGCIAGWYSVYRIKRSGGRLWGGRWAFTGAIILPVLLLNAIAILLVIETRLWVLLLAGVVVYLNYRLIQRAWSWIACQRMRHQPEVITIEQPVPLGSSESIPAM